MRASLKGIILALSLFMLVGGGLTGCVGSSDEEVLLLPKGHKQMTAADHKALHPNGHDRSLGKRCIYDSETDKFYCNFPEGK